MNKSETVFILGNGFDLNLNLKTGYGDFLNSDFFNQLLLDGSELCVYLKEHNDSNKWIDIENELKVYSREVCKDSDRRTFRREYQMLCNALCEYLKVLDMSSIDKTSKVYKIITSIQESVTICNFNYTPSIDHIIEENSLNHKVFNIHGKASNNKIVFGIEDGARINPDDIFLKKSTCLWNDIWDIESLLIEAKTIVFLGYSLGETDHHYFNRFFQKMYFARLNTKKKNIIISYFKEDGMYEILKQIDILTSHNIQELRNNQNFIMKDLDNDAMGE